MNERTGDQYAFLQMAKAAKSGQTEKAKKWSDVLSGILSGTLNIGSRQPVDGMPSWATPDVMRGGFATGGYSAGGMLQPHEKALASRIGVESNSVELVRTALNHWHLSDAGRAALMELIETRQFVADTPEETALLTIALLADEHTARAVDIVRVIAPFFDRLRFYPRPVARPRGKGLHLRTVGAVRETLARVETSPQIRVQHDTLSLWLPLYDALMDLVAERASAAGADGAGAEWQDRARAWQAAYDAADKSSMAKRWRDKDGPFQRCRRVLNKLLADTPINVADENYAALHSARHAAKYGSHDARAATREAQRAQDVRVWHDEIARIVRGRLEMLDAQGGIEEIAPVIAPIGRDEAADHAPAGAPLTRAMIRKVSFAQSGSLDALIEGGQIGSAETMATLIPQIAAQLFAQSFADPRAGDVFAATYQAFHERRSLLLLDLQSQVKLEELPWAAALFKGAGKNENSAALALALLDELVRMAITHFPYAPFPNPFVEQMQILGKSAGLPVSFVPELAADIFMGRFSPSFEKAAAQSIAYFRGSFYADYYLLPDHFRQGGLARLCLARLGGAISPQGWSVAFNGMQIEQAMILTSHNLAASFASLPLNDVDYTAAAQRCFAQVCARLSVEQPSWHADLIAIKQSAYRWRYMIGYMSQITPLARLSCWGEMKAMLADHDERTRQRLSPMMARVNAVMEGHRTLSADQPIFLGWTLGKHVLQQR